MLLLLSGKILGEVAPSLNDENILEEQGMHSYQQLKSSDRSMSSRLGKRRGKRKAVFL